MSKIVILIGAIALLFYCPSQSANKDGKSTTTIATSQEFPEVISFMSEALYPEGVAYNAKEKIFYVSSLRNGSVGSVSLDGKYTEFINDESLVSAIGLKYLETNNQLVVCSSDPGVSKKTKKENQGQWAKLAIYDLDSKKQIALHDLGSLTPGGDFCNDMVVDKEGNFYITDSFSPVVFRVGTDGKASIFAESDKFKGEGFGLNGLVYHPGGYLIVANASMGILYKINLDEPKMIDKVVLDKEYKNADGLLFDKDMNLILIQNVDKTITRLKSEDDWATAKATGSFMGSETDSFITTGTIANGDVYVLVARLSELFSGKEPLSNEFAIKKAVFK